MSDEQTTLDSEEQKSVLEALVSRLKEAAGELGGASALDASIRLWDVEPVEVPHVPAGEYVLAHGRITDRIGWLARHCFPRVDDEGSFSRLRVVWHWHGTSGKWRSKGRVVMAKLQAVPDAIQAAWGHGEKPKFAPEYVLVLNAFAWGIASATARVRGVWRAFADHRGDPLEIHPAELRLFGLASQEAVSLHNSLDGDPMVGSAVQLSVFDEVSEEASEGDDASEVAVPGSPSTLAH